MLKLSPTKCWSDTTVDNVCSCSRCNGLSCHTKALLPKLRARVNRHGKGFRWHKLVVFWASSLRLPLMLSIAFQPSFPLLPLLMHLYFGSVFWCESLKAKVESDIFFFCAWKGQQLCVTACVWVYRSRSWVRDLSSVFLPLRAGVLVLHVGSLKGLLDFSQRESTNRRRLDVFPKDSSTHTHRVRKRPEHSPPTVTAVNPVLP